MNRIQSSRQAIISATCTRGKYFGSRTSRLTSSGKTSTTMSRAGITFVSSTYLFCMGCRKREDSFQYPTPLRSCSGGCVLVCFSIPHVDLQLSAKCTGSTYTFSLMIGRYRRTTSTIYVRDSRSGCLVSISVYPAYDVDPTEHSLRRGKLKSIDVAVHRVRAG